MYALLPTIPSRTASFVCKVLFCANYARHHRLANFNFTVTLIPSFQLMISDY